MSVFLLPLEITKDIERSLSRFWWQSSPTSTSKTIHWMSWDRMSKHKTAGGLGFRNFGDFNLGMLGKQGWRFITKPESLASRVYKARYYADKTFLDSELGNNPSFIWRSVWEAKNLLLSGSRWRIGSGERVNIIEQPWLIEEDHPFITTNSEAIVNQKVASLMCTDRREWDVEVIRDIFNQRDQQAILNIPLSDSNNEDCIFWSKEASGLYSVRSAYKLLQSNRRIWNEADNEELWGALWKIKAPPKVLNLMWRALSRCLPTKINLSQKHVRLQSHCPVCCNGDETIMHALVTCPVAVQCWRMIAPSVQIEMGADFSNWFSTIITSLHNDKRAEIVTTCWAIWRARNNLVWNNKRTPVNRVVATAKQHLLQWKFAQTRSTNALLHPLSNGDGACVWVKPQTDTMKVTSDAAIFNDRGEYGMGLVARDSTGELVQARTCLKVGMVAPVVAEAMAVKEALSWINMSSWPRVELETDSLVVVQAIRSRVQMPSYFGRIIEECRRLIQDSNKVFLYFIRRSANMVAHEFARASYRYPDRVFDMYSVPVELKSCIQKDLSY